MQFMFLLKLKIWNYIQHDLGFDPFSLETVSFFMLCFISEFYELLTFYSRINKDDYIIIIIIIIIIKLLCTSTQTVK